MSWYLCKSLTKLREQVNTMWPERDKESDGSIGDTSHSARKSDHNPNSHGAVTAIDIDRELKKDGSVTVRTLVEKLQASKDKRIKYIIWNGQITVPGDITKWKLYHGANAHKHHAHISVSSNPALYDDDSDWDLGFTGLNPSAPEVNVPERDLRIGDKSADVRALQNALIARGFMRPRDLDGDFGRNTQKAVKEFQRHEELDADGIVGDKTKAALGL